MKKHRFLIVLLVALFATAGSLFAQQKYAIIIGGNMNPDASIIPLEEQWNGGIDPGTYGFDEIWNDAYLAWEMLITENKTYGKGYHVDNVHVLFDDGNDFTFVEQDIRYKASYNGHTMATDNNSNYQTLVSTFTDLATTITKDDFLFVWIMSHGGVDVNGHYFYSNDFQKIYDSQVATWLSTISAHRKVVYLSFPKSGGFSQVLQQNHTVTIASGGATDGAYRSDDMAPSGTFIENEVHDGIICNYH